jgi:phosphate/sulfate permease
MLTSCKKNIVIYGAISLTAGFFFTFIFICIKYAKKLKTEIDEKSHQSGGILLFVIVISAIALLAVIAIFFGVPVSESQKYIVMAGIALTVVGKFVKKRS